MKIVKIRKTIMFKILAPLLMFLVLQTCVISIVFFEGNIINESKNNAYDAFNEKVITRKNYTEKEMVQRFASLDNALLTIDKAIKQVEGVPPSVNASVSKQDALLINLFPTLIDTIKNNGVTGAYIVLTNGEVAPSEVSGVYLRCETPLAAYRESIYINVATPYVQENGLKNFATYENNLLDYFDFSSGDSSYDYFLKPYNAVNEKGKTIQESIYYAYWAKPHQILKGGAEVISYSVPIFYNGVMYGIFGIDLSINYMEKFLPYGELDGNNKSAYALCSASVDGSYSAMLKTGALYTSVLGASPTISLADCKDSDSENNYLLMESSRTNLDTSLCVTDLNLYMRNSYFHGEKFTLIGMIQSEALFSFTNDMSKTIIWSLAFTDIAGVVLIVLVALFISRPVARLPIKVRQYSKNMGNKIQRTGIYEIDTLITSIEELTDTVTYNSSKMSKIIELSGVPLGAFELNKIDDTVVFTDKVSAITDNPSLVNGKITTQEFLQYLKVLNDSRLEDDDYTRLYSFVNSSGEMRFISLQAVDTNEYLIGVLQDVTKERINRSRIEYERDYDLLTSLLNRRAFLAATKKLFSTGRDEIGFAALVLMDMDNLKVINDTFGHEQGDEYLRAMAKSLMAFPFNCRVFISRYSGDEYVMLLYGYDTKEALSDDLEKLALHVGESYMLMATNQKVRLRCSGGIAFYPDDSANIDELISYADYAMYEIKQTTKGKFNEFNLTNYQNREYRTQNYEKFNNLIDKNLIDYNFQPIVGLKTGKILGYEALMRSLEPAFSNPQEIINLASAQHKLYYIERLTWLNAIAKYSERADKNATKLLFVNSIPSHILDGDDIEFLEKTYPDLLSKIVIEFTEAEKFNEELASTKKQIVKRWGGNIALDDFGAGYSNDSVLLTLNPYYIKVDMFIIRDCDKNQSKRRLLQNIVTYASERRIKVIAEGVETRAELETIMRCKVNYVQGFYIARPNLFPLEITQEKRAEIIEIATAIKNKAATKE